MMASNLKEMLRTFRVIGTGLNDAMKLVSGAARKIQPGRPVPAGNHR